MKEMRDLPIMRDFIDVNRESLTRTSNKKKLHSLMVDIG